jgi:hypothetical protein
MTDLLRGLVEFNKARLAEDERRAYESGEARIAWLTYRDDAGQMRYTTVAAQTGDEAWVADGRELAPPSSALVFYDPARALREIEARRRIIAEYEENPDEPWPLFPLLEMAAVYDDHPDYKPEWGSE